MVFTPPSARVERGLKAPLTEVTQQKYDPSTKTRTTTKMRPPNWGGIAALGNLRNNTAQLAIVGVDSKEPKEDGTEVQRVVWVKAKTVPGQPESELDKAA
jgi:hypothetical protein